MADTTIISQQTHIAGRLEGHAPVEVQGQLDGEIHLEETLTVAQTGRVHGSINVQEAWIEGEVHGSIQASERIVLLPSARVNATLHAPIIRVDDGARLKGEVTITADPAPTRSSTQRVARPVTQRVERKVTPKVEQKAAPKVEQKVAPKVEQKVAPKVEQHVTVAAAPSISRADVARQAAQTPRDANTNSAISKRSTTTVVERLDPPTPAEPIQPQAAPPTPAPPEPDVIAPILNDEITIDLDDVPAEILAKYNAYTVKELREELRRLDQTVSGTKTELMMRLIQEVLK